MAASAKTRAGVRRSLVCGAAILFLTGCAGIQPFEPRNHREEGPARGVFTGPKGAVIIPVPADTDRGEPESAPPKSQENIQRTE